MCLAHGLALVGQGPSEKPKAKKVALHWLEGKRVEGLTEDKGFQATCYANSVVYPHKKPALVLTAAEVAEARLTNWDLSRSGRSSENYMVTLHLTKEARAKLAAACESNETRYLTVVVDGKHWGVHRYEKDKDKPLIPAQARAEAFTPSVGFFSSKAEAERLVAAFK
jgi:hypothetical protein